MHLSLTSQLHTSFQDASALAVSQEQLILTDNGLGPRACYELCRILSIGGMNNIAFQVLDLSGTHWRL